MKHVSSSRVLGRRTAAGNYDQRIGLNMTPMVDVVMVILIFFMASAAMLGPEWLVASRVPKKGGVAATVGEMPLRIAVKLVKGEAGTVFSIGEMTFTRDEALAAVSRGMAGRGPGDVLVMIDPDRDVPYEDVVIVHAACTQLGISKVGLAGEVK